MAANPHTAPLQPVYAQRGVPTSRSVQSCAACHLLDVTAHTMLRSSADRAAAAWEFEARHPVPGGGGGAPGGARCPACHRHVTGDAYDGVENNPHRTTRQLVHDLSRLPPPSAELTRVKEWMAPFGRALQLANARRDKQPTLPEVMDTALRVVDALEQTLAEHGTKARQNAFQQRIAPLRTPLHAAVGAPPAPGQGAAAAAAVGQQVVITDANVAPAAAKQTTTAANGAMVPGPLRVADRRGLLLVLGIALDEYLSLLADWYKLRQSVDWLLDLSHESARALKRADTAAHTAARDRDALRVAHAARLHADAQLKSLSAAHAQLQTAHTALQTQHKQARARLAEAETAQVLAESNAKGVEQRHTTAADRATKLLGLLQHARRELAAEQARTRDLTVALGTERDAVRARDAAVRAAHADVAALQQQLRAQTEQHERDRARWAQATDVALADRLSRFGDAMSGMQHELARFDERVAILRAGGQPLPPAPPIADAPQPSPPSQPQLPRDDGPAGGAGAAAGGAAPAEAAAPRAPTTVTITVSPARPAQPAAPAAAGPAADAHAAAAVAIPPVAPSGSPPRTVAPPKSQPQSQAKSKPKATPKSTATAKRGPAPHSTTQQRGRRRGGSSSHSNSPVRRGGSRSPVRSPSRSRSRSPVRSPARSPPRSSVRRRPWSPPGSAARRIGSAPASAGGGGGGPLPPAVAAAAAATAAAGRDAAASGAGSRTGSPARQHALVPAAAASAAPEPAVAVVPQPAAASAAVAVETAESAVLHDTAERTLADVRKVIAEVHALYPQLADTPRGGAAHRHAHTHTHTHDDLFEGLHVRDLVGGAATAPVGGNASFRRDSAAAAAATRNADGMPLSSLMAGVTASSAFGTDPQQSGTRAQYDVYYHQPYNPDARFDALEDPTLPDDTAADDAAGAEDAGAHAVHGYAAVEAQQPLLFDDVDDAQAHAHADADANPDPEADRDAATEVDDRLRATYPAAGSMVSASLQYPPAAAAAADLSASAPHKRSAVLNRTANGSFAGASSSSQRHYVPFSTPAAPAAGFGVAGGSAVTPAAVPYQRLPGGSAQSHGNSSTHLSARTATTPASAPASVARRAPDYPKPALHQTQQQQQQQPSPQRPARTPAAASATARPFGSADGTRASAAGAAARTPGGGAAVTAPPSAAAARDAMVDDMARVIRVLSAKPVADRSPYDVRQLQIATDTIRLLTLTDTSTTSSNGVGRALGAGAADPDSASASLNASPIASPARPPLSSTARFAGLPVPAAAQHTAPRARAAPAAAASTLLPPASGRASAAPSDDGFEVHDVAHTATAGPVAAEAPAAPPARSPARIPTSF